MARETGWGLVRVSTPLSSGLISHHDWRLFLFGETAVERMFLECHQNHWLRYEVAGAIHRIEFPSITFEEYAHELLA